MFLKLRDWIDKDKLEWAGLSQNPNAVDLLKQNLDNIHWYWIFDNANAIDIMKAYPHKLDWSFG